MSTGTDEEPSVDDLHMWGYARDMSSPARVQREAKELSDTLREALQRAVERSGVDLKELAARVGRADGYFSHLFKGRITLTSEHIFTVFTGSQVPESRRTRISMRACFARWSATGSSRG